MLQGNLVTLINIDIPLVKMETIEYSHEYENIRSVWVAITVLFLLWRLQDVIQTFLRATTMSGIRRRGGGYLLAPTGESSSGGTEASTGVSGHLSELGVTDWVIRIRHAGRVARDTFLQLVFLALLCQIWMLNLHLAPLPPTAPPAPLPPGPHPPHTPGEYKYREEMGHVHSVFTPFLFSWIIAGLAFIQIIFFIAVEPWAASKSRHRRGYQHYGPGIYGRQEGLAPWLDAIFESAKLILTLIAAVMALNVAYSSNTFSQRPQ